MTGTGAARGDGRSGGRRDEPVLGGGDADGVLSVQTVPWPGVTRGVVGLRGASGGVGRRCGR